MAMSAIDKELLKCVIRLDDQQKKSLMELIRTFLQAEDNSDRIVFMDQYNKELDEAMQRVSKGEFARCDELEKEILSWEWQR